ncbi:MAG TPA: ABC transporter permease [Candidatus Acidoferrum sp.]|nr:ABC transporter permease [Candidatus Acidoferrum sp.]
MFTLWQDIRYGLRMLGKNPGFTFIAIATLALGIGANTAIFSLLNAVMLQSIPVRNPQQLVVLRWMAHGRPQDSGSSSFGDCQATHWSESSSASCSFPYPVFKQIRSSDVGFSSVAAFAGPTRADMSGYGEASMVQVEMVSGDYFQTLGVPAALGRTIQPDDEREGAEAVVVLSHAYWERAFGSDKGVVGKAIKLNGVPFTIVGVADAGFTRLTPGKEYDMWVSLTQFGQLRLEWGRRTLDARNWWLVVLGRLKPGVTPQQAQAAVSLIFRNATLEYKTFKPENSPQVALLPAQKALSGIRGRLGQPLTILMIVVAVLLLIACANVAGLLLARATTREREMAVRLALGAGRGRLVRQLLTESLMLSFAGAALGVLVAYWGAAALAAFVFGNSYGSAGAVNTEPDATVLAFTIAVAALTGILFGLAPAFRSSHVDVGPVLKENAGSISGAGFGSRRRFGLGSGLVVAQVALSVMVLAGAGLVVRSLANLKNINPGFDTHNVLQFAINPSLSGYYKTQQMDPLFRDLQRRLSALPGVQSVTYSSDTLLDGGLWTEDVKVQGRFEKSVVETQMLAVGSDFFSTMKIPLLAGRPLSAQDMSSTQKVAVVNRAFVEKFLEKRQPLGLEFGPDDLKATPYEIVGVVGDTKYAGLRDEIAPTAYIPLKDGEARFALRTAINPLSLVPAVRKTVSELDSNLPVYEVRTQAERIERLLFNERLLARLASLFGLLALALACIGLYGLLAYEVFRRTREIGIRSALGAQSRDVLRLVGVQGVALIIFGAVLGIAGALGVTRLLGTFLYGVTPRDPLTFLAVCGLLITVGIAACYIPARRASRVDPMVALRYE